MEEVAALSRSKRLPKLTSPLTDSVISKNNYGSSPLPSIKDRPIQPDNAGLPVCEHEGGRLEQKNDSNREDNGDSIFSSTFHRSIDISQDDHELKEKNEEIISSPTFNRTRYIFEHNLDSNQDEIGKNMLSYAFSASLDNSHEIGDSKQKYNNDVICSTSSSRSRDALQNPFSNNQNSNGDNIFSTASSKWIQSTQTNQYSKQTNIGDTTILHSSNRPLDISVNNETSLNELPWNIRSKTQIKESILIALSNYEHQKNDNASDQALKIFPNDTENLNPSPSTISTVSDNDNIIEYLSHPRGKSMLASKSSHNVHDNDEIKSVKFHTPENCSVSNVVECLPDKGKSSPLSIDNYEESENKSQRRTQETKVSITSRHNQGIERPGPRQRELQGSDNYTESLTPVRTGLCRCANLSTQRGRRNHALLIMLMSVIPVVALIVENSIDLSRNNSELRLHKYIKQSILFSVQTGNVIHMTQIERAITSLYVSSKGDAGVKERLLKAHLETDRVIYGLTVWFVEPEIKHFRSADSYHSWIKKFREKVLSESVNNLTTTEVIRFYSEDNAIITRWVGNSIQASKSGILWKTLVGYYMLILSKEEAGIERAMGSVFYGQGGFSNIEMLHYMERKILGITYFERCKDYTDHVSAILTYIASGKDTFVHVERMRREIIRNSLNGSDVEMGAFWLWNMTEYIDMLKFGDSLCR